MKSLLIANRGEIAIRVMRAAAELGIRTVAVYSEDDATSLHTRKADEARPLPGQRRAALPRHRAARSRRPARPAATRSTPATASSARTRRFARACAEAGLTFVGPRAGEPRAVRRQGRGARAVAQEHGVPVLPGTAGADLPRGGARLLRRARRGGAMMIKAVAGGGGRGMRVVHDADELDDAYARCRSEAQAAFGNGERSTSSGSSRARATSRCRSSATAPGASSHFWERDCSLQRRHQKIVEIAPSPGLPAELRDRMLEAAVRLAAATRYENLGTFEFLVDAADAGTRRRSSSSRRTRGSRSSTR